MREIKFRGRNYDGVWLYGYLMPTQKPQIYIGCKYSISASPKALISVDKEIYEVVTETIGQFTGLYDKNGKEIYEGDVVRVGIVPFNYIGKNPEPYYVDAVCVYSPGSFLYKRISPFDKKKLSRNWTYKPVYRHDIYTVEIIGNITDNEDLLKDGRD